MSSPNVAILIHPVEVYEAMVEWDANDTASVTIATTVPVEVTMTPVFIHGPPGPSVTGPPGPPGPSGSLEDGIIIDGGNF